MKKKKKKLLKTLFKKKKSLVTMLNISECYKERKRKCVMGWIRELEKELSYGTHVPTIIKQICAKYIKNIEDQNKICFCGCSFKSASIYQKLKLPKSSVAFNWQINSIKCNFCGHPQTFMHRIIQFKNDAEESERLFPEMIQYCDNKNSHHEEILKCYPGCIANY